MRFSPSLLYPGAGDPPPGVLPGAWRRFLLLGASHWPMEGRHQSTSVTRRHQWPGAATAHFGIRPPRRSRLHRADISRDYGDSLSSSGVAVNIGSEGEEEDSPRGGPHQIQFPQHTIILFREFTYRATQEAKCSATFVVAGEAACGRVAILSLPSLSSSKTRTNNAAARSR